MSRRRSALLRPPAPAASAAWRPAADVYRLPAGWLVKLDLAGVQPAEVEVSLRGRHVTVRGARRDQITEPGRKSYCMEIAYNRFERVIDLPVTLEAAAIVTDYRDGMLLIRVQTEVGDA